MKTKIRLLILTSALLATVSALRAQDAARARRTPVDTSRSSLPAYQNTPTAKPGPSRKKPSAKTTPPMPTPGATKAPGSGA